jgi:hypothetical protein
MQSSKHKSQAKLSQAAPQAAPDGKNNAANSSPAKSAPEVAAASPVNTAANAAREAEEKELQGLVALIRTQQGIIEAAEQQIKTAKERLTALLIARGENWSDEHGYARLSVEGQRTSYDAEALDKMIINNPLHYGWLKDFRRISIIPPRVLVR